MTFRYLAAAAAFACASVAAMGMARSDLEIEWAVEARDAGSVQLDIRFPAARGFNRISAPVKLSELRGLTNAALARPRPAAVEFSLVRPGGALSCSGASGDGSASGSCRFLPAPDFAATLTEAGVRDLSPPDQLLLTLHGVDRDLLSELRSRGIRSFKASDLVEASLHGVDREYLREISAAGRTVSDLRDLAQLKMHGVTGAYLRQLGAAQPGLESLPAEDLVALVLHGVRAADVRKLKARQAKPVTPEELLEAKLIVPAPPPPPEAW